jgi:hypothetical protein
MPNKIVLSLASGLLFFLTSCSQQPVAKSDEVQACIDKLPNSKLLKKQAVTTGCLVSMAFWKAIGQDNPVALVCVAGGGAGFLLGQSIAERKCSYRVLEEQLDGEIAHTEKVNMGFPILFAQKTTKLAEQETMVNTLLAQKKAGTASINNTNKVLKTIHEAAQRERELVQTLAKETNFKHKTLNESQRLKQAEKIQKLRKEIALLHKNIKKLREENLKLYRLENKLSGL